MVNMVGALLKEHVLMSSDHLCTWTGTHVHTYSFTFHLYQIVISTHYHCGIALDLRTRSLTESLITSLQTWSKITKNIYLNMLDLLHTGCVNLSVRSTDTGKEILTVEKQLTN